MFYHVRIQARCSKGLCYPLTLLFVLCGWAFGIQLRFGTSNTFLKARCIPVAAKHALGGEGEGEGLLACGPGGIHRPFR